MNPISQLQKVKQASHGESEHGVDVPSTPAQNVASTEAIVQELLAKGLRPDQIVMPGGSKGIITCIAEDFDAPIDEFAEYS